MDEDIGILLSGVVTCTVFKLGTDAYKAFKLLKSEMPFKYAKIKVPEQQIYVIDTSYEELYEKNFGPEIIKFIRTVPDKYTNLLKRKLLTLKIVKTYLRFDKNTYAEYDIIENIITIHNYDERVLFHELFHASSSYTDENQKYIYSGFAQGSLKDSKRLIANSLDEGYTEHLVEKYFASSMTDVYRFSKRVAELVEFIIGENLMQDLYFSANLKGLIYELSKYSQKHNVLEFLQNLEFVATNISPDNVKIEQRILMVRIVKIIEFLNKSYNKKINILYSRGYMTKLEYHSKLIAFLEKVSTLTKGIELPNYEFDEDNMFNKCLTYSRK